MIQKKVYTALDGLDGYANPKHAIYITILTQIINYRIMRYHYTYKNCFAASEILVKRKKTRIPDVVVFDRFIYMNSKKIVPYFFIEVTTKANLLTTYEKAIAFFYNNPSVSEFFICMYDAEPAEQFIRYNWADRKKTDIEEIYTSKSKFFNNFHLIESLKIFNSVFGSEY